jgi:putative transposase
MPTLEQEQTLESVLWRCRELYNAGLQERNAAWERRRVCVSFAMQSAQLPAIKEVRQEYCEINAQVLQDVLHRLAPGRLRAPAQPSHRGHLRPDCR